MPVKKIGFSETSRSISVTPGLSDDESAAAGDAIGQLICDDDPLFGSREVFGVTPDPFLEGTLDGASLLLDAPPDFDLAHLLPGVVGLSQQRTEALVIQAATPDLPPDYPVLF